MTYDEYYEKQRQKKKETDAEWRKNNPEKVKANRHKFNLKYNFDLTTEQYDNLLEQQGGVCAVCGKAPESRRLAVDHNHTTGKVRGLLCSACNIGIGMLKDSPEVLEAAISYLNRHKDQK